MVAIRNEYKPIFGRERLTLWSGQFCSDYEGSALQLPNRNGYMVQTFNGRKVRVECESPRTDENYLRVDEAINEALKA